MKEHGYEVAGKNCYDEYRSLLKTYRAIKDKASKTGESAITWEYYHTMNAVLGNKPNKTPDEELSGSSLGSTFETEETSTSESTTQYLDDIEMAESTNNNNSVDKNAKPKKKIPEMTMKRYLFQKNKKGNRDEEEAKKRWEEKEEIENKIAEALLARSQNL
ncbi:unnamed protein product [Phaedon cochleariae]|uniref:Uncharacterized protein n=1 Tax=Phaedon cochleariae TaxID=80249 RepID=A0A9N9SJQ2_PHACE|nr:unnamed protein product [Phaedon cochleariae]